MLKKLVLISVILGNSVALADSGDRTFYDLPMDGTTLKVANDLTLKSIGMPWIGFEFESTTGEHCRIWQNPETGTKPEDALHMAPKTFKAGTELGLAKIEIERHNGFKRGYPSGGNVTLTLLEDQTDSMGDHRALKLSCSKAGAVSSVSDVSAAIKSHLVIETATAPAEAARAK